MAFKNRTKIIKGLLTMLLRFLLTMGNIIKSFSIDDEIQSIVKEEEIKKGKESDFFRSMIKKGYAASKAQSNKPTPKPKMEFIS